MDELLAVLPIVIHSVQILVPPRPGGSSFFPREAFSLEMKEDEKNIIARFPTVFQLPSIIMRSKPCLITPSGRVVISLSRILMCQSDLLLPPPTLLYAPRAGPFGQQGPSEIGYNQFVVATPVGQFPRPDLCICPSLDFFISSTHDSLSNIV